MTHIMSPEVTVYCMQNKHGGIYTGNKLLSGVNSSLYFHGSARHGKLISVFFVYPTYCRVGTVSFMLKCTCSTYVTNVTFVYIL